VQISQCNYSTLKKYTTFGKETSEIWHDILNVTEIIQDALKSMWHMHIVCLKNCDILQRNPGYQAIIAVKKHLQA